MHAIIISEFGPPEGLRLEERPRPSAQPGQLLIRTAFASVNYFDVLQRQGSVPGSAPPIVPGIEISGTVESVGAGVEGFVAGERVMAIANGGYAEYVAVDAAHVLGLAGFPDVDLATCACLPVTAVTAYQVLNDVARLRPGDTVLVNGATGGVGSLLAQVALALGSTQVIGVVGAQHKAAFARDAGYTDVLVRDAYPDQVGPLTGGEGVDVVVEMGGGDSVPASLRALAPLGRLVYMGDPAFSSAATVAVQQLRAGNAGVLGYSVGNLRRVRPDLWRAGARAVLELVREGRLHARPAQVFPLARAADAHALLETRAACGKLLLQVA